MFELPMASLGRDMHLTVLLDQADCLTHFQVAPRTSSRPIVVNVLELGGGVKEPNAEVNAVSHRGLPCFLAVADLGLVPAVE